MRWKHCGWHLWVAHGSTRESVNPRVRRASARSGRVHAAIIYRLIDTRIRAALPCRLMSLNLSTSVLDFVARDPPLEITRATIYRWNLLVESSWSTTPGLHWQIENFVSTRLSIAVVPLSKSCSLRFAVPRLHCDFSADRNQARLTRDWIDESKAPRQILFFNIVEVSADFRPGNE